jgi:hypothetical protein
VRAETHRGHEDSEGRARDVQRQPVELAPADVGGGGADHMQNRADSRDRGQRRRDAEGGRQDQTDGGEDLKNADAFHPAGRRILRLSPGPG